jgi:poly-gamma-glutamate system protein
MFMPTLKNNWSLFCLAVLSLSLFYIVQTSYREIQSPQYEEKLEAAHLMETAMRLLKNAFHDIGYEIDKINDPNETGLIGTNISSITTSPGSLTDRLVTLNPNYAAVFIDYLRKMDLWEGDYVAVGLTGANPGANIALYAAMETMKLKPIIITSIGSATYGANREMFTWLDMEKVLYDTGTISFYSEYATMGGTNDLGRGLPPEGRTAIIRAIERNHRILIEGDDLEDNIEARMEVYERLIPEGQRYRAFINIGAGVGNVGSQVNARIISSGVHRRLGERDFREPGTMMHFAKRNIPVLHVFNISRVNSEFGMPSNPIPLPQPGYGAIFSTKVNNVKVAVICLVVLVVAITSVIIFDRHDRKFTSNLIESEDDL